MRNEITNIQIRDLLKQIRSKCNIRVTVYDFVGYPKGRKSLPLWYSDTKKLCFPDTYYTAEEVLDIKEFIEEKVRENNWNVKVEYEKNYWIGGLHTSGYKLKLKLVDIKS